MHEGGPHKPLAQQVLLLLLGLLLLVRLLVLPPLLLGRQVLAAPAPERTLHNLAAACPPAVRAQAERLSLADVMRRTQRPPVFGLRQRISHGLAERREVARWASSLGAKWQVWRTALEIGRTDTGRALAQRVGLRPSGAH